MIEAREDTPRYPVRILDGGVFPQIDPWHPDIDPHGLHHDAGSGAILHAPGREGEHRIEDFHVLSLEAGADDITTASWNLSVHIQHLIGKGHLAAELAGLSVRLAGRAIDRVYGPGVSHDVRTYMSLRSLGDTNTCQGLPPDTAEGNKLIRNIQAANIAALVAGRGDRNGEFILLFETAIDDREITIVQEEAEKADIPIAISARPSDNGETLRNGVSWERFIEVTQYAAAIGLNCHDVKVISKAHRAIKAIRLARKAGNPSLRQPGLMLYGNGHNLPSPYDPGGHVSEGDPEQTHAEYLIEVVEWLKEDPTVESVGGCCGVKAYHISDIRTAVRGWESAQAMRAA